MIHKFFYFLFLIFLSCQHSLPRYLSEQGLQQGALYLHARSIKQTLKDPMIDSQTREYLQLGQDVITFAERELGMSTKGSYQSFLKRPSGAVSYIVMAAHKEKLEAHLFEYPLFGALPYRGYFKLSDAQNFARTLQAKNLDVYTRPVAAYSTTGWLPDPVVSSMFNSPIEYIQLLLHELVHVQFYLPNEADFNEAYATWFAEKATQLFLEKSNFDRQTKQKLQAEFQALKIKQKHKHEKILEIIEKAQNFYTYQPTKNRENLFLEIQNDLARDVYLSSWSRIEWNNAVLLSLSTYHKLIPQIDLAYSKSGKALKEFLYETKNNTELVYSTVNATVNSIRAQN
jgi:predicted aminopeptidase